MPAGTGSSTAAGSGMGRVGVCGGEAAGEAVGVASPSSSGISGSPLNSPRSLIRNCPQRFWPGLSAAQFFSPSVMFLPDANNRSGPASVKSSNCVIFTKLQEIATCEMKQSVNPVLLSPLVVFF